MTKTKPVTKKAPPKGGKLTSPFVPTDEQRELVKKAHGYGLPQDQVRLLVINPNTGKAIPRETLAKYFAKELEEGRAVANNKVLTTAFSIATDTRNPRCAAMNMFWQKTRMGFKETEVKEHTGKDGAPLGPQTIVILPAKKPGG